MNTYIDICMFVSMLNDFIPLCIESSWAVFFHDVYGCPGIVSAVTSGYVD